MKPALVWKTALAAQARIAARFFATAPPKDFRGHSLRSLVWRKSPQGAHTAGANLVGECTEREGARSKKRKHY